MIKQLRNIRRLTGLTSRVLRAPAISRSVDHVKGEYSSQWDQYRLHLEQAANIDEWLTIKGFDDKASLVNYNGRLLQVAEDLNRFNREALYGALTEHFPNATSITEYGCGVGRNLLYLKRRLPHLSIYGYELCESGVQIAQAAADRFALDVSYHRLDYVTGAPEDYIFPHTDVGFTMFSLEQLSATSLTALENILNHVALGTIHIEPVPEKYPWTIRGLLGRLYHSKADYVRHLHRNVLSLRLKNARHKRLNTCSNPLMFPSLYVLHKHCEERGIQASSPC